MKLKVTLSTMKGKTIFGKDSWGLAFCSTADQIH